MSEYSYYEFQAVDRPLGEAERKELRRFSSRATITPTRFSNHYEWGSFKGNPAKWMEKYFDAYFYMANWSTRELSFRLPKRLLDPSLASRYCCGACASARMKGEFVILDFLCEDGEREDYSDDGAGWLSTLLPLRAELLAGDHRALYLAWLLCVQLGGVKEDGEEPPLPAGLAQLTEAHEAFAELFDIDPLLIAAAATKSPPIQAAPASRLLEKWVEALPAREKNRWLVRLATANEPQLGTELRRVLERSHRPGTSGEARAARTVAELCATRDGLARKQARRDAERAEAERAQREREAAEDRERHLASLEKRQDHAWRRVDSLISTKRPSDYDQAVALLLDLREIGTRKGQSKPTEERIRQLWEAHAKKPSLLERLRRAGLLASQPRTPFAF